MFVNGEKYIFSESVIEAGKSLYKQVTDLNYLVNVFYNNIYSVDIEDMKL